MRRHFASFHYEMMENIIPPRQRKKPQKKNSNMLAIRKCLVKMVSVYGRPLQIIDDSPMKHILSLASNSCERFVQRQLREDIESVADDVKKTIREELQGKSVSISLDIVTKYCRSFLGANVQYIHEDKLVLRTIGMLSMDQSHTGAYISQLVTQLATEYGLESKQIYSITTDNAKNVVKSIRDLKNTIGPFVADIDLSLPSDDIEADEEALDDMMNDDDFEALSNILYNDDTNGERSTEMSSSDVDFDAGMQSIEDIIAELCKQLNDSAANNATVQGLVCAAHTLQLAIMDALKNWPDTSKLITKCIDIVKFVRTPNVRRLLKLRGLLVPNINIVTRWNSMYLMVNIPSTSFISQFQLFIQFFVNYR